ncbi:hypothetical protein F4806DRAFT_499001 [Annulohypoxylon nitens]|nr:hypothetical protein F4806DRAFT_499001 [Annulohypoxylon nitens]
MSDIASSHPPKYIIDHILRSDAEDGLLPLPDMVDQINKYNNKYTVLRPNRRINLGCTMIGVENIALPSSTKHYSNMDAPMTSPSMAQRQFSSTTTTSTKTSTSQGFAQPPPATQKTPSTDAFIRDLNLVAEAAKRAQMAVLMRDLDSIAIS